MSDLVKLLKKHPKPTKAEAIKAEKGERAEGVLDALKAGRSNGRGQEASLPASRPRPGRGEGHAGDEEASEGQEALNHANLTATDIFALICLILFAASVAWLGVWFLQLIWIAAVEFIRTLREAWRTSRH